MTTTNEVSTDRIGMDERGHMSCTFYVRDDTTFRVVYTPESRESEVALFISGYGGSMHFCVSRDQWDAIVATAASVIPAKEPADTPVSV